MWNHKVLCCILLTATTFSIAVLADFDRDIELPHTPFISSELSNSPKLTLNDTKHLLRKIFEKATGVNQPQVYENLYRAVDNLMLCANEVVNITGILNGGDAACHKGDLYVVFQKYCSQAEQCQTDLDQQLSSCLTGEEKVQNIFNFHLFSSLLSYVCLNDGVDFSRFIAEGGPDLLGANKSMIFWCINESFGSASMVVAAEAVLRDKQCIELHEFGECVLGSLDQSNNSWHITSEMVDYLKGQMMERIGKDNNAIIEKQTIGQNVANSMRTIPIEEKEYMPAITTGANSIREFPIIIWGAAFMLRSVHKFI